MINHRNFLLLLQGSGLAGLGYFCFSITSMLWLADVADSASLVGLVILVGGITTAAFISLGGVVADRYSRKKIVVWVGLSNGLAIVCLAFLFFFSNTTGHLIYGLFITQIVLGLGAGFSIPAFQSLLPETLPLCRLAMGYGALNATSSMTQIIGRGLGAVLFVSLGAPLMLLISGVSYLCSAISQLYIRLPASNVLSKALVPNTIEGPPTTIRYRQHIVDDLKQGLAYVLKHPGITPLFLLMIAVGWCGGSLIVNLPFLVRNHFQVSLSWYGALSIAMSLGVIAGSFIAGRRFNQHQGFACRSQLLAVALISLPLLTLSLGVSTHVYNGLLAVGLFGVSLSLISVITMTQLQAVVPNRIRGRVMALLSMCQVLGFPLSGFISGLMIDAVDKNMLWVQGFVSATSVLMIYPFLENPLLWNKKFWVFVRGTESTAMLSDD